MLKDADRTEPDKMASGSLLLEDDFFGEPTISPSSEDEDVSSINGVGDRDPGRASIEMVAFMVNNCLETMPRNR